MTCQQIHPDGCQTSLEPAFAFCPQCGRATVSLRAASPSPSVTFATGTNAASLPLSVQGQQTLVITAHLEAHSPLRFIVRDEPLETFSSRIPRPATLAPTTVSLKLNWAASEPPPTEEPLQIPLFLTSYDAAPQSAFDIEPANRARVWEPLYLLVRAPRPARLEIETEVLLLGGRDRQRALTLHNAGETPLLLRPPLLPAGFEIEAARGAGRGPGEWTLAPGARKSWTIRASKGAKIGATKVALLAATGQNLGQFEMLVPSPGGLVSRTRYVLGVDFGTSGTSVWKRDGREDRLPAEPLRDANAVAGRDDPTRFPSVLYVSFVNGHETGFFIGYEAAQRHRDEAGKGLWVRELKTLLRTDDEPFVTEFGPNYRVDLLLRRYLEKLRAQIILPQLEGGEAVSTAVSVAWNFSLPVLDSHRGGSKTLFNRQKSRLERAIRDAGYVGSGDALEFFTEPYCAAIYLLLEHGNYRYPRFDQPRDGDWACIFDSGGGTTDVVLGQLRFDENQMRFEEVSTLGGYLASEIAAPSPGAPTETDPTETNPTRPKAIAKTTPPSDAQMAPQPAVVTFGGEAITRTTAIYLSVWQNPQHEAYDFLRYEVAALRPDGTRGFDREAIYDGLQEVATLARTNEEIWRRSEIPRSEISRQGEAPLENGWLRFPDLWEKTERYKRQLASLGAPGAVTQLEFPPLVAGDAPHTVKILRQEFDRVVVNRRLDAIGAAMRSRVFATDKAVPAPVEVKWVFGVGGNCRVRRVGDWLQEFFPGGVQELSFYPASTANGAAQPVAAAIQVDESDRMLAVAGGAVWASKASRDNILPYALRLENEFGEVVLEAAAYTPLRAVKPAERITDVPFEASLKFRLFIAMKTGSGGENHWLEGVAGTFAIRNLDPNSGAGSDLSSGIGSDLSSDSASEVRNEEPAVRSITLRVGLENRRLVALSDETGAMQEVFSYNI